MDDSDFYVKMPRKNQRGIESEETLFGKIHRCQDVFRKCEAC